MMGGSSIHVVSFQWPVPPDYGGAADVFHKIRALEQAGAEVTLHSYTYRDRACPDISDSPASHNFVYKRDMNPLRLFSPEPFIVATRRDRTLLGRLATLPPLTPVIFEGLHTCSFLNHPALADKLRIVRAHNVEHEYYAGLARRASGLKKIYLSSESRKLRRFFPMLGHAGMILAISPADAVYHRQALPDVPVIHIPCFYDDKALYAPCPAPLPGDAEPYILYHGSLCVEENVAAVEYICNRIMPLLPRSTRFVVAGRNPSARVRRALRNVRNFRLAESPSPEEMSRLISGAAVTLLFTPQDTGIKIKLLDTLANARGAVVANSAMIPDLCLAPLVALADSPEAQAAHIRHLMQRHPGSGELARRRSVIEQNYGTLTSAHKILDAVQDYLKTKAGRK